MSKRRNTGKGGPPAEAPSLLELPPEVLSGIANYDFSPEDRRAMASTARKAAVFRSARFKDLDAFAHGLKTNPETMFDAIIDRLKFTPYPNRTLRGIPLYVNLDKALGAAVNAKLRDITDMEKAKLVMRVVDAAVCPEHKANQHKIYQRDPRTAFMWYTPEVNNERVSMIPKLRDEYFHPDDYNISFLISYMRKKIVRFQYRIEAPGVQAPMNRPLCEMVSNFRQSTEFTISQFSADGKTQVPVDNETLAKLIVVLLKTSNLFHTDRKRQLRVSAGFADLCSV